MTSIVDAFTRYTSDEKRQEHDPAAMGGMSETKIVEFEDGTKFVVKTVFNTQDTTNEYLAQQVALVMGIPVPDFIRVDDLTMIMSFIPGETATNATWQEWESTDWRSGKLSIFDAVIRNIDRNSSNIIRHAETGVLYAIDHALSFPNWGNRVPSGDPYEAYTPDEVAAITVGLYDLHVAFVDEGMGKEHTLMMERWNGMCDRHHND